MSSNDVIPESRRSLSCFFEKKLDTLRRPCYLQFMREQRQHQHPKPEIVGNYRVVYPIFREDLAEASLMPLAAQSPAAGPPIAKKEKE